MSDDMETMSLDQLLLQAGRIVFLLQQLENTIELCCAFLRIDGIAVSVDDILTTDPERRGQTLGQMVSGLKRAMIFHSSFNDKLGNIVTNRNAFIHKYWVNKRIYALDQTVDSDAFQEILAYEERLYKEIVEVIRVFLGLGYSIGEEIAQQEGKLQDLANDNDLNNMKQFVPNFLSVVNS
jgi:uncharacterized protein YutE (UPF0331/DUF86 family)